MNLADFDIIGPRLPPHHEESEQAVLGGLLLDNTALDRIDLAESDFYRHEHRLIWKSIVSLLDQNRPADVITVAEALEASGELERVGGLAYVVALQSGTPSAANIRSYAKTVKDRAMLRRLVETGTRIADMGFSGGDAGNAVAAAQQAVMELDTAVATTDAVPLREALRLMVDRLERVNSGEQTHTTTGFPDLDRKIIGMGAGDMIVVAGRPSMGKTAFALKIAEYVSERLPVLVFSMEMEAEALATRQAASHGRVPLMAIRNGTLDEDQWGRLTYALSKLRERQIMIDDRGGLSIQQIRARARQVKRKRGLGLVVIDYLGLIQGRGENRVAVVSEISREIKNMARELGVPVVALSQLNRGVEQRTDKRPMMSDLRESGSIEQDADLILLLYRDEYYNPDSQWKGVAECIIAKQRNGPTGMVPVTFIDEYARFESFSGRFEPEAKKPTRRGFE